MAYYTESQLLKIGFRHLGKNVKISDRSAIYNPEKIEIGDYSRIDDFCVVSGVVKIGKYVHIAPHCLVAGGDPGIVLDDFAGLAYFVQVFSQSDDYSGHTLTNPTVSSKYKMEKKAAVHIGRHVIVGAGSIVMPGVQLAEGCSVGALTLVHKTTEPWGIYAGNPCKRIKERKRDLLQLETQFLEDKKNDSI
jgi:acetyltransferase-like isoleucine patch superfamily enzyme